MIESSVFIPSLILPLIKYGIYYLTVGVHYDELMCSYNALMYHGAQVEQCLLLRILHYVT